MQHLTNLKFMVNMGGNAASQVGKLSQGVDKLNQRAQQSQMKMAGGALGMYAAARGIESFLSPAIEMDRSLGEIKSLSVRSDALKALKKDSLAFSIAYGGAATDFVKSSYDIQSSIDGLKGRDLGKLTNVANILAKGTKADAAVITDYMGTMYGIFKEEAKIMGTVNWAENLAGQTALAVEKFKTDGSKMAAAFGNLGAEAQSFKISMSEQIAVMGTLQSTMSGSESGTKYRAFLNGVSKAQDKLGISLTDSNGKMLAMPKMLAAINSEFTNLSDPAQAARLKEAFGSSEAVGLIKILSAQTGALSKNINDLANVKGYKNAIAMAKSMADPWERLSALGTAGRTMLGDAVLPTMVAMAEKMLEIGGTGLRWMEMFPTLTKVIGFTVLAIGGAVAMVSLFSLVSGVAGGVMMFLTGVMVIAKGVWAGVTAAMKVMTVAQWLFNAAVLANPISLMVMAVIAGIALLSFGVFMLIKHWDSVTLAVESFVDKALTKLEGIKTWFKGLGMWLKNMGIFDPILNSMKFIGESLGFDMDGDGGGNESLGGDAVAFGSPLSAMNSSSTNNSRNMGDVIIHTTEKVDGAMVHNELAMMA